MDAGDSWGGLIKTPFYSLGGVSLSLHTLTPTISPLPPTYSCLPDWLVEETHLQVRLARG